tara:strand:- start:53 stop:373 length:321 start_codon:yes stop_codon:yes gene_type:complete
MAFIGKNGCLAWCKFTGSGDVANTAIGYNISSAADNGEGDYTVNFTTSCDGSESYAQATGSDNGSGQIRINCRHTQTASSYRFTTRHASGQNDPSNGMVSFFGNQT